MKPIIWPWYWAWMRQNVSADGLMSHLLFIWTCMDTQELLYLWVTGLSSVGPGNRSWCQEVQVKAR